MDFTCSDFDFRIGACKQYRVCMGLGVCICRFQKKNQVGWVGGSKHTDRHIEVGSHKADDHAGHARGGCMATPHHAVDEQRQNLKRNIRVRILGYKHDVQEKLQPVCSETLHEFPTTVK